MSNQLLVIILFLVVGAIGSLLFPLGVGAILIGMVLIGVVIISLQFIETDREYLLRVFLIGLILRFIYAAAIYTFKLQDFFGPDASYYDWLGTVLSKYWWGELPSTYPDLAKIFDRSKPGWGIYYVVGSIYYLIGQNTLAVQMFCAVLGAATAPITYLCSKEIFSNKRVARISSMIVALCPSLILWSAQGLKDGIIIFLLVLSVVCVLKLKKGFNFLALLVLMTSLFGILSLRFYIFYMLVVAIVGCFAIGGKDLDPASFFRRAVLLLLIGLALMSLGSRGSQDISSFNLQKVNSTRRDLARGNGGFAKDTDVSTTGGALAALPLGLTYLMLAPFPWQLGNLRQAITMPEMVLWWSSIPFLGMGLWYSIKKKLRTSIAALLFTLLLTISYSLYQGNIGTAYRQRAQIQIFHFIFIAAGYTLWKEKIENLNQLRKARKLYRQSQLVSQFIVHRNKGDFKILQLQKNDSPRLLFDSQSFSGDEVMLDGKTLVRGFHDPETNRWHVAINDLDANPEETDFYALTPQDTLQWLPDNLEVVRGDVKPLANSDSVLWLYDFSKHSSKQSANLNPDTIYCLDVSATHETLLLGQDKITLGSI
jgi:hypothetical protein